MGEFCQIIEMHKKESIVNSRVENTVPLIKDLQGGFRMRLYIEDG